jgi:UDP-N-acetylglucosamine 4,6-dehydratase
MSTLSNASLLVTGATGSFGKAFIRYALDHLDPARLVIFSRDELKQYEVRSLFEDDKRLRWFIGDVRDRGRLTRAMHGVDHVVHAAALKQVDTAEYNPFEYVQTNVIGSQNVVEAAIDAGVKKVIALSTDKASSPINLYGATKLAADKLVISANHYASGYDTRFAVVRYGNVMGSRGSVIPFFKRLAQEGKSLPVTDMRMTRFWITLPQAVEFVVNSFDLMGGGELYVPRIPSVKVTDLVAAVAPGAETHVIGIRPGEKLHEEMIAPDDSRRTRRLADRYVVQPMIAEWGYVPPEGGTLVPDGFAYRSDTNEQFLSVEEMRELIDRFA